MQRRQSRVGVVPGTSSAHSGQLLAAAVQRHRRGRLDEAAELYRRILATQPAHADALHLLGLIKHARGAQESALSLIERAIGVRDEAAAFHVSHAAVLLALRRPPAAVTAARRALALDAGNAEAHNTLGNALLTQGDAAAAAQAYAAALAIRPEYAEAHNNLGNAWRAQTRVPEAEASFREAIRLRPGYASALANLGLLLQEQARYGEALEALQQAVAADPEHAAARGNRAMLLLLLGQLAEGFAEYEWRWRMPGFATPRRAFPQPVWDGSALNGAVLLVHAEQGLGSAIQFARYVPLAAAKGGRVVLECQRPLLRLFRQSLVTAGAAADVIVKGEPLPPFDRHAPLMSLPHLLGTTLATIPADVPYLRPDPSDVAAWRQRLSAVQRPRVGLVWAGNRKHENDHNRSMPAAALAPLVAGAQAGFVSLQVPADAADLAPLTAAGVADVSAHLGDFADTAAAIATLDLVISVDTAAAHLAGALGRPAWLLLPFVPEWRWLLNRDDSPWYPSLRLFRQGAAGDWAELIGRVRAALDREAAWPAPPE